MLVLVASASVVRAQPYSLQLGAFPGQEGAATLKADIEAKGFLPVAVILAEDGLWKVRLGSFDRTADAYAAKRLLESRFGQDSFLTPFPVESDTPTSIPSFFRLEVPHSASMAVQSLKDDSRYERLEALDTPGNKTAYAEALRAELPGLSASDPLTGYIRTNLGIVEIIKKDYDAALGYLRPVADGEVASAASHRVMAMIRVAWILHQQGDRLSAYQAYRAIESWSALDIVKARARVECAGLMMELAESEKGSHEEVRREIETILAEVPETVVKHRAVAELMYLETYARQPSPDYSTAATLGEQFLARYSGQEGVEREIGAAMTQTAMYHRKAGNRDRALQLYNRVLDEVPQEVETFAGVHYHAQALLGISIIAAEDGDMETMVRLRRRVISEFPQDNSAQRLIRRTPWVNRRPASESQ